MDARAILQRTDIGLDTIKTKSVRLTQSERLLLILVDGVTPFEALRQKVWALTEDRFARALDTLLQKDLIYEVLFPLEDQQAEELDSAVVDRFLQQDPLDPVTIIRVDPEDELDTNLIEAMGYGAPPPNAPAPKEQALPEVLGTLTSTIRLPISPPTNSLPSDSSFAGGLPNGSLPTGGSAVDPLPESASQRNSDLLQKPLTEAQYKTDMDRQVVAEIAALTSMINAKKLPENEVLKKESFPHEELIGKRRIYWADHLIEWCSFLGLATGIMILIIITARHLF